MNTSREEKLFELALEKPSDERPDFLDAVCGEDQALRSRVDALLAAHNQQSGLLPDEAPTESSITLLDESALTEGAGTQIGRNKLVEKLGKAGSARPEPPNKMELVTSRRSENHPT